MTPDLAQVIHDIVHYALADVNTALPARILSYDAGTQKADVQPLVKRRYKDGQVVSRAAIKDVPVIFPAAGGGILTFPVAKGDTVLLIFCQRSIDRWVRSSGGEIDPLDNRKHDISDAVAIPGLFPFANALSHDSDNVTIKFSGASIQITPDGEVKIVAPGGFSVEGDSSLNGDVSVDGDETVTGTVEADGEVTGSGIALSTHTHPDPQGGTTGPPT